jgi:hypothetical protein
LDAIRLAEQMYDIGRVLAADLASVDELWRPPAKIQAVKD